MRQQQKKISTLIVLIFILFYSILLTGLSYEDLIVGVLDDIDNKDNLSSFIVNEWLGQVEPTDYECNINFENFWRLKKYAAIKSKPRGDKRTTIAKTKNTQTNQQSIIKVKNHKSQKS